MIMPSIVIMECLYLCTNSTSNTAALVCLLETERWNSAIGGKLIILSVFGMQQQNRDETHSRI
jgi:hypothetical protein